MVTTLLAVAALVACLLATPSASAGFDNDWAVYLRATCSGGSARRNLCVGTIFGGLDAWFREMPDYDEDQAVLDPWVAEIESKVLDNSLPPILHESASADRRAPIAPSDTREHPKMWDLYARINNGGLPGTITITGWVWMTLDGSEIVVELWKAEDYGVAGKTPLWTVVPGVIGSSASPNFTSAPFNYTGVADLQFKVVAYAASGLPATPAVTDDGAYTTGLSSLHATWFISGATEYQYAWGKSPTELVVNWKTAGSATGATETGLTLEQGRTYYCYVKAKGSDGLWGGVAASDGIIAAGACALGFAKSAWTGKAVYVADAVVTSVNADYPGLWIESSNRASGVKVGASWSVARGDRLEVAGVVSWTDGVPVLTSPEIKTRNSGQGIVPPLLTGAALASDPTESLVYTGLSPVGLLVTCCGKVTAVDSVNHVFYLDDGSGRTDGMGPSQASYTGLRVSYKPGIIPPGGQTKQRVTGIRTVEKVILSGDAMVNGKLRHAGETLYLPVLVIRDAGDVTPLN